MTFRGSALLTAIILLLLLTGTAGAQAGQITVNACQDQNADGICAAGEEPLLGAEACLNDETSCQPVPATFAGLPAGDYAPFLRFAGSTQGYYPTTARTPVTLAADESATVTLGAVYPVHPKGVAVHAQLNKVYVAFQGPIVDGLKPYPFVAVIDGETDEVLRTIPGGENGSAPGAPNGMGIGREPWGVGVSGNGKFVYVGSFGDGIITAINPDTDTVITNVSPGAPFQPTSAAVNPITGRVHFPDHEGGRVIILNDDPASFPISPILTLVNANNFPSSHGPFETVIARSLQGHNFLSMRNAINSEPLKFLGFNTATISKTYYDILFDTPGGQRSGIPHAVGLWQDEGVDEAHLFITYADDTRQLSGVFPNPNKLLVYNLSLLNPENVTLSRAEIEVGDYAEVGLVYNPATHRMLGTYAGFAYVDNGGDEAACNHPARGGTYATDREGNLLPGVTADVWKFPGQVVGNPPYVADNLQWRNPFEIALNPNNNKVYVPDRCWSDYPASDQVGGAVLIFEDIPDVTPTPTPTVTGTPPTETPTATGTPPTATPTITGTPPTATPTVTGTPPTATPVPPLNLVFNGPASVISGDTFSVTVQALDVGGLGLYGAQFEINYNPSLISAGNLQINPDLPFVILQNIHNEIGQISFLATRQGQVAGLMGNVPLLTFEATAIGTAGEVTFTFANERIGDPMATPFDLISHDYSVSIQPQPTVTSTPSTATPTVTSQPPTATPTVTGQPPTSTPTVTGQPPTPTMPPSTSTPTVTGTPPTPTPTMTSIPPTPTPTPTSTPAGDLMMTGLVYDATGGPTQIIPEATVSVLLCQPRRYQTQTGTDGRYSLLLPGIYLDACTQVTIEAWATGHETVSLPVSVADLRAQPERDFALPPLTSTPTPTPSTPTPTMTGTPPTSTPTVTGTPPTSTPTPSQVTPTVTGTPPT
ncbi:MAG: hypothetical protein JW953_16295, partial [Anaerolineae bacterium]|nr:hypothetical protein [Anaerolineae bacterium]